MNNEQARAGIIASFERNIATLEAERDALTDDERVLYIVTCSDLPINVAGEAGKIGGMVCPIREATRFASLRAAQSFAARVVNGLGEVGHVVTLGSAYNAAIEAILDQISYFDSNAD
jgi:hypothetical protein